MANIPFKSITFPELPNKYTVPEISSDLMTAGKAADAKATGDALSALEDSMNDEVSAINESLDTVRDDLGDKVGIVHMTKNLIIGLNADPVSLTPLVESGWSYAVLDCTEGDKFVINASGGNRPRAWGFIDSGNNILSVANAQATVVDLELTAPANAVKLIINDRSNGVSYKVGNNLLSKVEILTKEGLGLSEDIKRALLTCIRNAYWSDENGVKNYNALEAALYGVALPNTLGNLNYALGTYTVYGGDVNNITYLYGEHRRICLNPVLIPCYAGTYVFSLGAIAGTYQYGPLMVSVIDPKPTSEDLTITNESGNQTITIYQANSILKPWNPGWQTNDVVHEFKEDCYIGVNFKLSTGASMTNTDKENIRNNFTIRRIG